MILIQNSKLMRTLSKNNFSIAKKIEQMRAANPSPLYNITPNILQMTDRKLLNISSHPLSILTHKISTFFEPQNYHVLVLLTADNNGLRSNCDSF